MQRYDAVSGARPARGSKLKTILSATTAVLLVVTFATVLISALTQTQQPPQTVSRVSAAIKRLLVSANNEHVEGVEHLKGFWMGQASLSPPHHAPAQELHEMLAREQTLHQFGMLQQSEVKRSLACPLAHRCRYSGTSTLEQKSSLAEYEKDSSDPSGRKMKKAKESSGTTKTTLTVTFDVWETNATGCSTDTITWALNVSKAQSGDLETEVRAACVRTQFVCA